MVGADRRGADQVGGATFARLNSYFWLTDTKDTFSDRGTERSPDRYRPTHRAR